MCGPILLSRASGGARKKRVGIASTSLDASTKSIVPAPVPIEGVLAPSITRTIRKRSRGPPETRAPSPSPLPLNRRLHPMAEQLEKVTPTPTRRSTRKRAQLPRGVNRRASGALFIRFVCGQGHTHEEVVKGGVDNARDTLGIRRQKRKGDPAWCPWEEEEARRATVRVAAQQAAEA